MNRLIEDDAGIKYFSCIVCGIQWFSIPADGALYYREICSEGCLEKDNERLRKIEEGEQVDHNPT